MFGYCGSNPVRRKDPSGEWLEIIPDLFFYDESEENKDEEGRVDFTGTDIGDHLVIALSGSDIFRKLISDNCPQRAQCVNGEYHISGVVFSPYSSGNVNDIALRYSVGEAKVDITYSYYVRTDGRTVWTAHYKLYDGYTFEYWSNAKKNNQIAKHVNNCGYYLQQKGFISRYEWTVSGDMIILPAQLLVGCNKVIYNVNCLN